VEPGESGVFVAKEARSESRVNVSPQEFTQHGTRLAKRNPSLHFGREVLKERCRTNAREGVHRREK
jgi:hypothetical protein